MGRMNKIKHILIQTFRQLAGFNIILRNIDDLKILTAKQQIMQMKVQGNYSIIGDAEFKVFSQFGDDGIIQYVINNIDIKNRVFIEFGVEKYLESNTRFLLINDNWKGLVIDGDKSNIDFIKNDEIYWKYDLIAVSYFITRENINKIFLENDFSGDIGILSIDIDGNDYWVWKSIDVVSPIIVIIEYNSIFGAKKAVTIPYYPNFIRTKAHYSNLYWGASLKALHYLAQKKGYTFIGCNSSGNNAYFIRKDKIGYLKPISVEDGYIESRFREARDTKGRLSFLSSADRLKIIEDMPVVDVETGEIITIKSLCVRS
jgi:hypothetical protein